MSGRASGYTASIAAATRVQRRSPADRRRLALADAVPDQRNKRVPQRAAASLLPYRPDHGRRTEARDLLTSVYGWFTEGFDTLNLKEARPGSTS